MLGTVAGPQCYDAARAWPERGFFSLTTRCMWPLGLVHLDMILHQSLRQSYSILNYCPLHHALQSCTHSMPSDAELGSNWAEIEGQQ